MIIDGTAVQGAQNIFFAELASKSTEVFSVSATRFMSGKFPFMIFGLPAAAYAMYRAARPEKKKIVGGLLLSAALTSMLTGITEPLEFTFLFVAPAMYAVHCVLAGLSYMLMHIFNVGVGMTFSGGIIDLTLFGILQGNRKTHWLWIVAVGLVYAVVYYFVFYLMIVKFGYKTPGRESDSEETRLYTRKDVEASKKGGSDRVSALILQGLGGKANISDIDCCATRLRITVIDPSLVKDPLLKESGASGVIRKGNGIQAVYGPSVSVIKSNLEIYLDSPQSDEVKLPEAPMKERSAEKLQPLTLSAYMDGDIVPLEKVDDEVFSGKVLGDGIAIEPSEGRLYAPCSGKIINVFETNHAVNILSDEGYELLIHIGIDTVKLGGKHFTSHIKDGQKISAGDLLISFDKEAIKSAGYKATTALIICNEDSDIKISEPAAGAIKSGGRLMRLE